MNLFRRNNHRILLIDFKGLTVFELQGGVLYETKYFSAEDSGYTDFRSFLASSSPIPVHIIVDSAAEDFFIETVAHVSAADRQGLLRRKLDQHYRGVEYRNARVIGRESKGRRDDKVLFSALTRNQQIDPWIRSILKEEIPLKSISSPAYIFGHYVREQGYQTSANLLLVHWELSGIRQTYLLNGRTVFSRLTPLPSENSNKLLADSIMELCTQSREYLEAVKLLDTTQALDIQVFTPLLGDEAFASHGGTPAFNLIEHHNTNQLLSVDRYSGSADQVTALTLCIDFAARKQPPSNAYAPAVARRFYHLALTRQAIYATCLLALLVGGMMSAPIFTDALARRDRALNFQLRAAPIDAQYQSLREQFPETPIPSQAMELAVTTFNLIQGQAQSPNRLLIALSGVLTNFPTVKLNRLTWTLSPGDVDSTLTEALLAEDTGISLTMQGDITGVVGFQETSRQLQELSNSLGNIEGIEVVPLRLPIENSAYSAVNTTVDDNQTASSFSLNLLTEGSR